MTIDDISFKGSVAAYAIKHLGEYRDDSFSIYKLSVPDRRRYEESFGTSASIEVQDIMAITHGKKTLYERNKVKMPSVDSSSE